MSNQPAINYRYSGSIQPDTDVLSGNIETDDQGREYYPYVPSSSLIRTLNLAIGLCRPLLIEGEPGSGKTQIASHLVKELTHNNLQGVKTSDGVQQWWPFHRWDIKSTSQARDGLYSFDTIGRLRDAQLVGLLSGGPEQLTSYLGKTQSKKLKQRLLDPREYFDAGPLGKALGNCNRRAVLLIDEIDKADSDFPNDLLRPLDEMRYRIDELNEDIPCKYKPIILITSNRERPLPQAFLRRCVYYYVEQPDESELKKIITTRFGIETSPDSPSTSPQSKIAIAALSAYQKIVRTLDSRSGLRRPSTSEFLDFLVSLWGMDATAALEALSSLPQHRELLGTLIKDRESYLAVVSSDREDP